MVNLAPYSFFNAVLSNPPFVMFAAHPLKDTQTNAEATGEFTVSLATFAQREQMNETSGNYGHDESEPGILGIGMAQSVNVKPPRVAASPAALECLYSKTVPLVTSEGKVTDGAIVIGEVVGIYIDDAVLVNGMVDLNLVDPLSRLGYLNYGRTSDIFRMKRPAPALERQQD